MLGMSQPTDQQRGSRGPRQDRAAVRLGVWLASYLSLASAHCTFPEYNYGENVAGNVGVAGSGGSGATAGSSAAGSSAAGSSAAAAGAGATTPMGGSNGGLGGASVGAAAGDGGDGGTFVDPDCAAPQWPVDRCEASCVRRHPDHCYDGELSTGASNHALNVGVRFTW